MESDRRQEASDRERVTDEILQRAVEEVDATLIRWMLSLTPAQRLDVLRRNLEAVHAIRRDARTG